jgi:hypothetical protein
MREALVCSDEQARACLDTPTGDQPTMNTLVRPVKAKYLGILVARLIVRGDIQSARQLRDYWPAWRVCELRAIIGACRFANARYSARLDWRDWTSPAMVQP